MIELLNGQRLLNGQDLTSENRKYKLVVQSDGNLALYNSGLAIWSSQTYQKGTGPYFLKMQPDNHLCLYDNHGTCTWASNTHGKGNGKVWAMMQDNGNFVMYDEHGTAVWCTGTEDGKKAPEEYQGCGHNLV